MPLIQANDWGDVFQFVKQRLKERLKKYIHSKKCEVKKALPTGKSYHVLFLYTSTKKDNEIISKISKELKDKGFQCCSCHDKNAKVFEQNIEKSLNVLVLISVEFKNNPWCMRTLDITNTKQLNEQIHFIIPVLYDAEPPEILCCINSMDWSEENFGVDKIVKTIDESIEKFKPREGNHTKHGTSYNVLGKYLILFLFIAILWIFIQFDSVGDPLESCLLYLLQVFIQCLIMWLYGILRYIENRRKAKTKATGKTKETGQDDIDIRKSCIDVYISEDSTRNKSVPQTDQNKKQISNTDKCQETSKNVNEEPDTSSGDSAQLLSRKKYIWCFVYLVINNKIMSLKNTTNESCPAQPIHNKNACMLCESSGSTVLCPKHAFHSDTSNENTPDVQPCPVPIRPPFCPTPIRSESCPMPKRPDSCPVPNCRESYPVIQQQPCLLSECYSNMPSIGSMGVVPSLN